MNNPQKQSADRIRFFYFLYFGGVASFWPYIALFFRKLQFSGREIGMLMAVGPLVMLIAQPIWGFLTDRSKTGHRLLAGVCLIAILINLAFIFPSSFWVFLLLMALFYFLSFSAIPLVDTIAIQTTKNTTTNYGQIRAWGSFGYCVFAVIVGQLAALPILGNYYRIFHPSLPLSVAVSLKGIPFTFIAYTLLMGTTMMVVMKLPSYKKPEASGMDFDKLKLLLKNRRFLMFILTVYLFQTALCSNTNYCSLYLDSLKAGTGLIGWAMTIAAFSEVPIFLFGSRLFKRYRPLQLIGLASITTVLRFYLYTRISNPLVALLLQPLHALNFGLYYLGAVHFVDDETPPEWKTTGQTIFWAVGYGLAAVSGNLAGGFIIDKLGIMAMYLIMAGLALVASAMIFLIDFLFPKAKVGY